jgi:hypothetical protein
LTPRPDLPPAGEARPRGNRAAAHLCSAPKPQIAFMFRPLPAWLLGIRPSEAVLCKHDSGRGHSTKCQFKKKLLSFCQLARCTAPGEISTITFDNSSPRSNYRKIHTTRTQKGWRQHMDSNHHYFMLRAKEERAVANNSTNPAARRAHLELSARYDAMVNSLLVARVSRWKSFWPRRP